MPKTIAVIGLGSIGMRHAKNLREMGHHVWGYDPDMSKRLELGYEYTAPSPREMIRADAFVIASPTREHLNDTIMPLKAEIPLFVEKPIANVYLDGLEAVRMVGYNLRFHSCVHKAWEWLAAGLLGEVQWAHFNCSQYNAKPAYLRDGVILNWSHEIDLALHLLGPAKVVASHTRIKDGHDDMTNIILEHDNGIHTIVHLDYLSDPEYRGFVISGSKASMSCDLPSRSVQLHRPNGRDTTYQDLKGSYDQDYKDEMRAFVASLDEPVNIGCTGTEALRVLDVCLKVRRQAGLL